MDITNNSNGNILFNFNLHYSYKDLPEWFFTRSAPMPARKPTLVIFNHELTKSLGLNFKNADEEDLAQIFSGDKLPGNAEPIAQAYAGHQFGHFTMLGDGRAHLIGELINPKGKRFDIHLKGSGRTPYSRNGDGRAALAPMLREYLISEAIHALKIPTTRSLVVVKTGEPVFRETTLQGAILTRVAASHLRVGTFEYAAARKDRKGLKALADYAIARHYPDLLNNEKPYLAFLNAVIERQAKLVASWMHVGFIHGVMNTDNMTISGETIDYGPCAFMDRFSMQTVFSSIDRNGRYAYGNQGEIAQWNLARMAETLLPLLHEDIEKAAEIAETAVNKFAKIFNDFWLSGMRNKLGMFGKSSEDIKIIQGLFEFMSAAKADYTNTFRDLISEKMPDKPIYQSAEFISWYKIWQLRISKNKKTIRSAFELMQKNNPVIIPRNHMVEKALSAAEEGNLEPFKTLLATLQKPFDDSESNAIFREPAPESTIKYQTFCGT